MESIKKSLEGLTSSSLENFRQILDRIEFENRNKTWDTDKENIDPQVVKEILKVDHSNKSLLQEIIHGIKGNVKEVDIVSENNFNLLVACYTIGILIGVLFNSFVLWASLSRKTMRTARNVFLVTLTVSDLLLCILTIPMTLLEVLQRPGAPVHERTSWTLF